MVRNIKYRENISKSRENGQNIAPGSQNLMKSQRLVKGAHGYCSSSPKPTQTVLCRFDRRWTAPPAVDDVGTGGVGTVSQSSTQPRWSGGGSVAARQRTAAITNSRRRNFDRRLPTTPTTIYSDPFAILFVFPSSTKPSNHLPVSVASRHPIC